MAPDFRALLCEELARRRRVNRRYSLRAFGEFLDIDHSTLSQVLRGIRPLPPGCLRRWAKRLDLGTEVTKLYEAAESGEDLANLEKRLRHMQWLAEATALMTEAAHWRLIELLRAPEWRPDTRWAAQRLGVTVDDLNIAVSRLLRLGMLEVDADGRWRDLSGFDAPTQQQFVECALGRLRALRSAD